MMHGMRGLRDTPALRKYGVIQILMRPLETALFKFISLI